MDQRSVGYLKQRHLVIEGSRSRRFQKMRVVAVLQRD